MLPKKVAEKEKGAPRAPGLLQSVVSDFSGFYSRSSHGELGTGQGAQGTPGS